MTQTGIRFSGISTFHLEIMTTHSLAELLRTTAQDIVKECRQQGESVSESLAIFLIRLTALDPRWQSLLTGDATENVIREVKTICVNKLMAKYNPSTATVKMQVYFDLNYRDREEFLKIHRKLQKSKLAPVLRAITMKPCNTVDDMEHVYSDIICFIIVKSGLGDPNDSAVISETKRAVATILPQRNMTQFATKSRSEKTEFLVRITPFVCGYRLCLLFQGKGGCGIQNVCEALREAAPKFRLRLEFELENVKTLIHKLERILQADVVEEYKQKSNQPERKDSLGYWKALLTCMHQFSILLHVIKKEAEDLHVRASQMELQCKFYVKQLNSPTMSACVDPLKDVFPVYKKISDAWSAMQEDALLLSSYSNVAQTLKRLSDQARTLADEDEIASLLNLAVERTPPSSTYISSLGDSNVFIGKQLDESRSSHSKGALTQSESGLTVTSVESADLSSVTVAVSNVDSVVELGSSTSAQSDISGALKEAVSSLQISFGRDHNIRIIFPESVNNFSDISLHLQGFCPWAVVTGNGVVLPANRDIGIIALDDCYYGFCCKIGAMMFLKNPMMYIEMLWEIATKKTELIFLLQIQDHFNIPTSCKRMRPEIVHPVFIAESGTQTVLHPIEKYIEPTYRWNQWDLRRLALKYVDMQTKKTHSTQTDLSHFRRENFSQVYLPKNNWSQTTRDGSTTMTKPGVPELIRKVRKTIL